MLTGIIFFFSSLTVFLILTEFININVYYADDITVFDFQLTLFALAFKYDKQKKCKKRAENSSKILKGLPPISASLSLIQRIIQRSTVDIKSFTLLLPVDEPDKSHINYGIFNSLFGTIFSYAEKNAKKCTADNIIIAYSDNNKPKISFELCLKISLLGILFSLTLFAAESLASLFGMKGKLWRKTK